MTDDLAAQTGWITYDEFEGPTLDSRLWEPFDVGSGPRLEPKARTAVGNGVITVDVPEFTNCDATNQGLDNTKHLLLSKQGFRLPADGVGRFAVDLRSDIGDGSGDYRQGLASFVLVDTTGETHVVLSIISAGDRFFAEQEVLDVPGQKDPFTRIIEDPFFFSRAGSPVGQVFRQCEIEINRSLGRVDWKIDGRVLHVAAGLTPLPQDVHIGFGMFTLLPIGDGDGSCHGQGGRASWRNFRHSLPT